MVSHLRPHLTLILYFQSTPFPSIVTIGVGVQHWNFEESSLVIVPYVFLIRIHVIFFKMESQYVAHGDLKHNPSASAFGMLGF